MLLDSLEQGEFVVVGRNVWQRAIEVFDSNVIHSGKGGVDSGPEEGKVYARDVWKRWHHREEVARLGIDVEFLVEYIIPVSRATD